MSDDRYNPWRDAAARYPHMHIERHPIAPLHAALVASENVILIGSALSRAERRVALAHELAHLDYGDRATDLCWFACRQESTADELAARRLINIDELDAVVRWTNDPREAAEELQVTLAVLTLRGRCLHPAERGLIRRTMSMREAVA